MGDAVTVNARHRVVFAAMFCANRQRAATTADWPCACEQSTLNAIHRTTAQSRQSASREFSQHRGGQRFRWILGLWLRQEGSVRRRRAQMSARRNMARKLCDEGRLSLYCYLGTATLVLIPSVSQIYYGIVPNVWGAALWGPVLYYALINMIIRFVLRNNNYQIALRATFLGFMEAVCILVMLFAPAVWKQFGVYGFCMAFFHYSEFLAIAWSNPGSLSVDSFILNHSIHYLLAAVASWLEFILEVYFLPDFKGKYYLWTAGIAICVFGEIVRKTAMITASASFTHLVQYEKNEDHKLITHGIYAYARHPSYVGWFWWSIGTQVILMNPLCILVYSLVSWKFFHDRIYIEEVTLLNFFRSDYKRYQDRVPTGLPFIRGYLLD